MLQAELGEAEKDKLKTEMRIKELENKLEVK